MDGGRRLVSRRVYTGLYPSVPDAILALYSLPSLTDFILTHLANPQVVSVSDPLCPTLIDAYTIHICGRDNKISIDSVNSM